MEEVRGSNPLCSTRREDRLTGETPSQPVFFLTLGQWSRAVLGGSRVESPVIVTGYGAD